MSPDTVPFEGWVDGVSYVAQDEALLVIGRPMARVAAVRDPLISLGVAQAADHPAAARAASRGWPTSHRRSGGTGLVHGRGDLLWSIVLPRSDPRVGRDFASAYGRLGGAVTTFLADLGLRGEWVPAANVAPEYCFLSGRGQVVKVDGRAVAGAAQHASRSALLHHGALCVTLDGEAIHGIFGVPEALIRTHLGGVSALGVNLAPEDLGPLLAGHLARFVGPSGPT
ncbi:MAG: hypothetical protein L3K17_04800 [Thermoplasmata archaeon]|nr:hypothetical protein [Thermoplasmata archaeon]